MDTLIPGSQAYQVLAAAPNTVGAQVLEHLAAHAHESTRYQVSVTAWSESAHGQQCELFLTLPEGERSITLVIGTPAHLDNCLELVERSVGKPFQPQGGQVFIDSRCVKSNGRIRDIGLQVLIAVVVHGYGWVDRIGRMVDAPFGYRAKREQPKAFRIVRGRALSPQELTSIPGLFIAPHVGEWGSGVRVIPAAARLPILLHEFRANGADAGSRINTYRDEVISDDVGRWGGVMQFSRRPEHAEVAFIGGLASSPFSFHIGATKQRFMQSKLTSSALLTFYGEARLRAVLETLLREHPSRFYRLIDAEGIAHRLDDVDEHQLFFGAESILRGDVVENVLSTYHELAHLELVPEHVLSERPRVVLDDSTYLVLTAFMMASGGEAAVLSGSQMIQYLFTGDTAMMHQVASEKVYAVLRKVVKAAPPELTFTVYDSSKLRLEGSQYDAVVLARAVELLSNRSLSSVG